MQCITCLLLKSFLTPCSDRRSLPSVSEVHRVDGAPWLPPPDQILAGGPLARVEALGSWRDGALGGGGGRGGGGRLVSRRVVTGAEHTGAGRVTRAVTEERAQD